MYAHAFPLCPLPPCSPHSPVAPSLTRPSPPAISYPLTRRRASCRPCRQVKPEHTPPANAPPSRPAPELLPVSLLEQLDHGRCASVMRRSLRAQAQSQHAHPLTDSLLEIIRRRIDSSMRGSPAAHIPTHQPSVSFPTFARTCPPILGVSPRRGCPGSQSAACGSEHEHAHDDVPSCG